MKRFLAAFLAIFMVFTMAAPAATHAAQTSDAVQVSEATQLTVSRSLFSLSEIRNVTVEADFGREVDLTKLNLEFGGKSLSEWKKWSSGGYNGAPFITVTKAPHYVDGTTKIVAELEFGLPFNTTNLSSHRARYKALIGDYDLALVDSTNNLKASTSVKLNVYDEYLDWADIKPSIDSIFEESNKLNNRYLEYQSPGQSTEGRDFHMVILAKDKGAVDKYLNETLPTALENPQELINKIKDGTMGDYQVPIWFNNIHPDEVEGIDFQTELLKKFAMESHVKFTSTEEGNNDVPVILDMDEVLDHIIFIFNFSHNPDGRVHNTRANANGFDLNRDNAYQTQVETIQLNVEIAKWTPLTMVEGHGYVNGFLIEPCTPPHNPNFEYDLLIEGMIEQAHTMGRAGIGNSKLTSYFLASEGYKDGWDDMGPSYTPVFAMLHGTLGHTVEVPSLSQDSLNAMVGTGLGATSYVFGNKDELYLRQLEVFNRGIKGEDNRLVDPLLTNAAGESIGRARGNNENFFPDYYVLPTDLDKQKNALEVYNMVKYLIRNGVKVEQTTNEVTIDGITYPKGTYIVPMKQAKRGLANAMLYKGDDVSDWNAMYDPVVVNFPALRGFDVIELRLNGTNGFEGNSVKVSSVDVPKSEVEQTTATQVLKNSNNDTIKLVNELLAGGKQVGLVQESKDQFEIGDFVVQTKDLLSYGDKYVFEAIPLQKTNTLEVKWILQPKVAGTGSGQLTFTLKELGFGLVSQGDAEVIISDSSLPTATVLAGKTFVGIGNSVLRAVSTARLFDRFAYVTTGSSHEGLVKATLLTNHQLTSGYEENELLYTTRGSWITQVPEGAEVLATVKNDDDFYVAGWWPRHEGAKGQTFAFTKKLENSTVTLFANDLAFRAHTKYYYRMLANSIFASASEDPDLAPVLLLSVSPENVSLKVGESQQLAVTSTLSEEEGDGTETDVTADATYSDFNEEVVTVSVEGNVVAVGEGTTTITVSYQDEEITVEVEVTENDEEPEPIKTLNVIPESVSLKVDESQQLAVISTLLEEEGDGTETDVTTEATYYGFNEEVVTVSQHGNVVAVGEGTTTITVSHNDVFATVSVIVTKKDEEESKESTKVLTIKDLQDQLDNKKAKEIDITLPHFEGNITDVRVEISRGLLREIIKSKKDVKFTFNGGEVIAFKIVMEELETVSSGNVSFYVKVGVSDVAGAITPVYSIGFLVDKGHDVVPMTSFQHQFDIAFNIDASKVKDAKKLDVYEAVSNKSLKGKYKDGVMTLKTEKLGTFYVK